MKCKVGINIILINFREKHSFRNYDTSSQAKFSRSSRIYKSFTTSVRTSNETWATDIVSYIQNNIYQYTYISLSSELIPPVIVFAKVVYLQIN